VLLLRKLKPVGLEQTRYQLNNTEEDIDYETGIDYPKPDRGRNDNLTLEDIEWAIEKGATSEDEIFKLVNEYNKELEDGNSNKVS
jgi:hypothetical protein